MKPRIICHMMSSVNGRLHMERQAYPYGKKSLQKTGHEHFTESYNFGGQADMMGRTTLLCHCETGVSNGTGARIMFVKICNHRFHMSACTL